MFALQTDQDLATLTATISGLGLTRSAIVLVPTQSRRLYSGFAER